MKNITLLLFTGMLMVFSSCESEIKNANTDAELLQKMNQESQRLLDMRNEIVMQSNDRNREMLMELFRGTQYEAEAPQIVEFFLHSGEVTNVFTNNLQNMYHETHRMIMEDKPTEEIVAVWNEKHKSLKENLQQMKESKNSEREDLMKIIDESRMREQPGKPQR